MITPLVSSSFSYRKFSCIRPTCLLNLNPLGEHTKEFILNTRLRKPMGQSRKFGLNKRLRKPMGQSRKDNPETLSMLTTQDTGRRQTKQSKNKKTKHNTKKIIKVDCHGPHQKAEVNPGAHEG